MSINSQKASKLFSKALKELAASIQGMDDEGIAITKAEQLAREIFDRALNKDKVLEGGKRKVVFGEEWAIKLIIDRLEGGIPKATEDTSDKPRPSERINRLAVEMNNSLVANIDKKKNGRTKK